MKETLEQQIEKYIKKGVRFIGAYERASVVTSLSGETVIEAIKYFNSCYNSTLNFIYDCKEKIIYTSKENDEPDERGYFNHSFYEKKTGKFIYNEDELTKPIILIKPVEPTKDDENGYINREGKFYRCGFEMHNSLARELFLSKTVEKPESDRVLDEQILLDNLGWVRISSNRINFTARSLTRNQKNTLIEFLQLKELPQRYEFNSTSALTIEQIEIELKENY